MADADAVFGSFARSAVGGLLERRPELATLLGEHAHDGRLTDGTADHYEELARWCGDRLAALAALDVSQLSPEYRADARILATQLEGCRFAVTGLREHEWNPMLANPGRAIYLLLARDFAPLASRLRSVAARLAAVPGALAAARAVAGDRLPRVHLETAISQFSGTERLITAGLDRVLAGTSEDLAAERSAALGAIREHRRWLEQRLADGTRDGRFRDPRIGPDLFARKLQLTLETATSPEELLARAQADLERAAAEITETAARLGTGNGAAGSAAAGLVPDAAVPDGGLPAGGSADLVRRVLDALAADAPDDRTILGLVQRAYDAQLAFIREHGIVTAYDDPVEVIEMPEIDRGVAVAYCDPPGPLETAGLPTFVAVSPAPQGWGARPGALLLPGVQPAHGAEPHGA